MEINESMIGSDDRGAFAPLSFLIPLCIAAIVLVALYFASKETPLPPPFFAVKNSELLPFLWHHPEFWPKYHTKEPLYLPGYYSDRLEVLKGEENTYAKGPPALFFRYHAWTRLVGGVANVDDGRVLVANEVEFNRYRPTYEEYRRLVAAYPGFLWSCWKNIVPGYPKVEEGSGEMPQDRVPLFLKIALFLRKL